MRGMHVSLKIFFLLVTSCNAACNIGRYCHAFLGREKEGLMLPESACF